MLFSILVHKPCITINFSCRLCQTQHIIPYYYKNVICEFSLHNKVDIVLWQLYSFFLAMFTTDSQLDSTVHTHLATVTVYVINQAIPM